MLIQPKETIWDRERDALFCWFPESNRKLDGYYHVRGGVCWPGTLQSGRGKFYSGYLALLGQNRMTMGTYLLGLIEFQTVSNVAAGGRARGVQFRGIENWLSDVRKHYACDSYYWTGPIDEHFKWVMEVDAAPMIQPKPAFIEVRWRDAGQAILHTLQMLNTRRLFLPPPAELAKAMEPDADADAEIQTEGRATLRSRMDLASQHLDRPDPDVWAVAVALHGLGMAPPGRME